MKHKTLKTNKMTNKNSKQNLGTFTAYTIIILAFLLLPNLVQGQSQWPQIVASKDGTAISYEVYGAGEPTLVFVHGWSCDSRYWQKQVTPFSKDHKIILVDLAGHGHSGMTRENYSMKAFGEDIQAVVEATGDENVILIGHSMGGAVIAEAARLIPQKVKGLIGVDTYENIEYPLSKEGYNMMISPFESDFEPATRQFVQQMLLPAKDTVLQNWIIADMAAAPPTIAISAMKEVLTQSVTGEAASIFNDISIPVYVVKGDLWPVDFEANRRHMHSFDAVEIENADHFLMLNRPEEFNAELKKAIEKITSK
jgi:pimeloyl-ACP methyl ester carboxylesterase